jgi:hypothetical protein
VRYATLGFDVEPRLGLVEMVWVTAKQSNNKARGRAAHPGAIRSITASTLKGLHSLEQKGCQSVGGTVRVAVGGTVRVAFNFLKHRGTEDTEKRLAPTQSLCELCASVF